MGYIDDKIEKIANYFGLTTYDIMRKDISRNVSTARNYIYYVLRNDCGLTNRQVSEKMQRDCRSIRRRNATTKYLIDNFKDANKIYTDIKMI